MTKKEFNLIKEIINERIKLDDIGPAVRLEEKQYNCESYIINSDVKEWY